MTEQTNPWDTDDGGPAFPAMTTAQCLNCGGVTFKAIKDMTVGMSLRDWFAGMALCGESSRVGTAGRNLAEWAYAVADTMLAEREKGRAK